MAKKHIQITIDPDLASLAKTFKINISEIAQRALESAIRINLEFMKENAKSLEQIANDQLETNQIIQRETIRIRAENRQLMRDMLLHARAAKEAGVARGQAEMDYGHVFPDAIWNGE